MTPTYPSRCCTQRLVLVWLLLFLTETSAPQAVTAAATQQHKDTAVGERRNPTAKTVEGALTADTTAQALRFLDGIAKFNCDENAVFDPITERCTACPTHATRVKDSCHCASGYAYAEYADSPDPVCIDCAGRKMSVSPVPGVNGSYFCAACGTGLESVLGDATFNADTNACECENNFSLVSVVNGEPLAVQVCIPCGNDICTSCSFPYQAGSGADGSQCTCVDGYTQLFDGTCVLTSLYETVEKVAEGTTMAFTPQNIENSGSPATSSTAFAYTRERVIMSAAACLRGDKTECQFLTNMCVLMNYNKDSTPCAMYLYIQRESDCEASDSCNDAPTNLAPWLYYLESSADIISSFRFKLKAWENLNFVVSTYDVSGNWLGLKPLVNELNQCHLPNTVVETFTKAGGTLSTSCSINWKWFLVAETTQFYEIFMVNPSNSTELLPIPVLVDFSNHKFAPRSLLDPFFYRSGWTLSGTTSPYYAQQEGYRRRFYVYDNVATRSSSDPAHTLPRYITAASTISLTLGSSFKDGVSTPMFVLQYVSKDVESYQANISQTVSQLPLSAHSTADTLQESIQMLFLGYTNTVGISLKSSLIVICVLACFTSLFRTYGYMRRRQNLVLDVHAICVFVMYGLDHAANLFLASAAVSSWVLLVLYKSQHWLVVALRDNEPYLTVLLACSVSMKAVVVLYRLVEQCNADYYIIDWERSKGQLLRENSLVPVSMWRSNFLAHQLNRAQSMRYLHPLVVMISVSFFLIGFHYLELSKAVPVGTRYTTDTAIILTTLRVAVDTFFWSAVSFLLYVLEFHIYYRFFVVHPLQAFVDLCSVSNISVMILLEPMWGFYIHGRSIHAHADVNMTEFQKNLALEAEGNLPVRGLGGQSQCQTFEVFLGPYMRQYLYMCQMEMLIQQQRDGATQLIKDPASWHVLQFLSKRHSEVYSAESMAIKDQVNQALQQSIHRAEGSLFSRMAIHRLLNFPPNIMYMNGAQRGDKGSKDLFFFDQDLSFERAFLCYLDFDFFMLYTGLFAVVDAAIENVFVAMVLTCLLDFAFQIYRHREGKSNFCIKTLINECFL